MAPPNKKPIPAPEELLARVNSDPDFVVAPRYNNSMREVLARYPDGAPARVIAQALTLTEPELEVRYEQLVEKLKEAVGA